MAGAMWHGKLLAESDDFELIEGNVYFPPDAVNKVYFKKSSTTTVCPWKGMAHYYTVAVEGAENPDAAWYYPEPEPAAAQIKDHIAFRRGLQVER